MRFESRAQPALRIWMLRAGIVSSVYYGLVNVVVPMADPSHRVAHQAVSELSAIDAPTRPLWVALLMPYGLLALLFGFGVVLAAGRNRWLHWAGWVLVVNEATGFFWPPMHQRGIPATLTDTLHIVFTAAWAFLMMVTMGLAAKGIGGWFSRYSWLTIAMAIGFGMLTGQTAGNIPKGLPTPWIGLWERINIAVVMVWIAVFAVVLLRGESHQPADAELS